MLFNSYVPVVDLSLSSTSSSPLASSSLVIVCFLCEVAPNVTHCFLAVAEVNQNLIWDVNKKKNVQGLGWSPSSSSSESTQILVIASLLCFGADVEEKPIVGPVSTEASTLLTDVVSWARCVWNSRTALRWKESSGCAVLLASVNFEVGAVWRDVRVWTVGSTLALEW